MFDSLLSLFRLKMEIDQILKHDPICKFPRDSSLQQYISYEARNGMDEFTINEVKQNCKLVRLCGLMDKASDFGAWDCNSCKKFQIGLIEGHRPQEHLFI